MLYQACALDDFDTQTGVCSHPVWVDAAPGLLPPLSVADGLLISSAIVGVWAVGFGFKIVRKFIFRS